MFADRSCGLFTVVLEVLTETLVELSEDMGRPLPPGVLLVWLAVVLTVAPKFPLFLLATSEASP